MHVPDGFTSEHVNLATAAVAAVAVVYGSGQIKTMSRSSRLIAPLLVLIATFIFAAQMLNFPIGGGTSGHFLGAALAACLLGPWGAVLALTMVLLVQGFAFADGGISALGVNIFNMGLVGGLVAYPVMRLMRAKLPQGDAGFLASVGVASWLSIVAASSVCAIELAISGASPLSVSLPAMAGVHALIGLGEAAITVAAVKAVMMFHPQALPAWAGVASVSSKQVTANAFLKGVMVVALALVVFLSPLASAFPDGLEKVAQDNSFMDLASAGKQVWTASPFPDYQVQAFTNESLSTAAAGILGLLMVGLLGSGLSTVLRGRE